MKQARKIINSKWIRSNISILITISIGGLGGLLFNHLELPLAWMIGAMVVTTIMSLLGVPLKGSNRLRSIVLPILGVMLGSAFNPAALSKLNMWIPSLIVMVCYVTFVAISISLFFRYFVKLDIITSFFSATPGGLATMVILGGEKGGNEQTIALTHSVRILLTVLIIPFWFRFFEGYTKQNISELGSLTTLPLNDGFVLLGCCISGFYIGKLIKLPSFQLLGPMILSTVIHISGSSNANPPSELVYLAQIIIGSGIGARFAGVSISHVSKVLISAFGSTIYILALAASISYFLASFTGLPFHALCIAFAPGGLAEMALISLSMGIDPAFVSTHHLLRVTFMVIMAPIAFQFIEKIISVKIKPQHKKK